MQKAAIQHSFSGGFVSSAVPLPTPAKGTGGENVGPMIFHRVLSSAIGARSWPASCLASAELAVIDVAANSSIPRGLSRRSKDRIREPVDREKIEIHSTRIIISGEIALGGKA